MKLEELPLPTRFLAAFNRDNPGAWAYLDKQRAASKEVRGEGVFVAAMDAARAGNQYAIDQKMARDESSLVSFMHTMVALGAWRLGHDIYRFHDELYRALIETEGVDSVPAEILNRLPSWGVYVEAPGLTLRGQRYDGFLAAPSMMPGATPAPCIVVTFLAPPTLTKPVPITLSFMLGTGGDTTIREALGDLEHSHEGVPIELTRKIDFLLQDGPLTLDETATTLSKAMSLLLYLCSEDTNEDFPRSRRPIIEKRVKGDLRVFPAEKVALWEVGARIGAALRRALDVAQNGEFGADGKPRRPHLRKAHWHLFFTGPRNAEKRGRLIKWLHPILVNAAAAKSLDDLPGVVHTVEPSWRNGEIPSRKATT